MPTQTKREHLIALRDLLEGDYVRTVRDPAGTMLSGNVPASAVLSHLRNFLINGDMMIAQRGTSFAGITTTARPADRWLASFSGLGTWTVSQQSDAPAGSGLQKSVKLLVTTADAAPAAADLALFVTNVEGQFLQPVRKGTSSAKQLTLSFWVKSNVTGTHIIDIYDTDNTRQVSKAYTVSAANTWEKKTILIPADTVSAWNNDSDFSVTVHFWLGAGSTYSGGGALNTVWQAVVDNTRAVGQSNIAAAINNYIQFTGVQLELGSVATEFEFLPFDVSLNRCQRYFEKSYNYSVAPGTNSTAGQVVGQASNAIAASTAGFLVLPRGQSFKVRKRVGPTTVLYAVDGTINAILVGGTTNRTGCTAIVNAEEIEPFESIQVSNVSATAIADRAQIQFQWTADADG